MSALDRTAIHIAVDMQCLFAEPTEWFVPWLPKVLPRVLEIAGRHPERTIFTRFMPPQDPEHASGAWRDYYQRWRSMTRDRIDPHLLELVEPLRKLVPPAKVMNKTVYSAFAHPRLAQHYRLNVGTIVAAEMVKVRLVRRRRGGLEGTSAFRLEKWDQVGEGALVLDDMIPKSCPVTVRKQ